MTREERRRLLLEFKMDPQGFAERAYNAVLKKDSKFLAEIGEALESIDPTLGSDDFQPFHERVAAAYAKLFVKHWLKVDPLAVVMDFLMNELPQIRPVLFVQAGNVVSVDVGEVGFRHGSCIRVPSRFLPQSRATQKFCNRDPNLRKRSGHVPPFVKKRILFDA
jgi:hypothetical protein